MRVTVDYAEHTIPDYAVEELCRRCHQRATHKIGETSGPDSFHPLTAYLCCGCFSETVTYDCRKYPYDLPSVNERVPELGGAVGRRASFACAQGQHDLCDRDPACLCRCHE